MSFSKQVFKEWQEQSVTQEFFKSMVEAIEATAANLITRRESNPADDQFMRGWIKGATDCLEWEPELTAEEEDK